jgi:uncharacterized membrane protein YdjX (TVP38/TMEM64 family)
MKDQTTTPRKPPGGTSSWTRFIPLALLGLVIIAIFVSGLHKQLTLENVVLLRDRFQTVVQDHTYLSLGAYVLFYASVVAASVPGSAILTLTGGMIFGVIAGGSAAVIGASIGAVIVFLIARTAFGETLTAKAGPAIAKLRAGFQKNALSYLLFLRFVPAFPFFLVNLASAVLGVPLKTYVIGTVIGVIPAAFAFASVGAGLDSIVATAKSNYASCMAAKGAANCSLGINVGSLLTTELKVALVLLGFLALLPVAYRKWGEK